MVAGIRFRNVRLSSASGAVNAFVAADSSQDGRFRRTSARLAVSRVETDHKIRKTVLWKNAQVPGRVYRV